MIPSWLTSTSEISLFAATLMVFVLSSSLLVSTWRALKETRSRQEGEVNAVEDMLSSVRKRVEEEKEDLNELRSLREERLEEQSSPPNSINLGTKTSESNSSNELSSTQGSITNFNSEIDELLVNQLDFYVKHIKGGQRQTDYHRILSFAATLGGLLVIFGAVITTLLGVTSVGLTTGALGTLTSGIGALLFHQVKSAEANSISDFDKVKKAVEEADRLKNTVRLATMIKDEERREYIFEALALKLALYNKAEDVSDSFISEILSNRPNLK